MWRFALKITSDNTAAFMRATRRVLEDKLDVAIDIVKGQAILLAPYDTGYLRGTIVSLRRGLRGFIGATASYAPHQEMGTSRMPAQPFLVPAVVMSKEKLRKLFAR